MLLLDGHTILMSAVHMRKQEMVEGRSPFIVGVNNAFTCIVLALAYFLLFTFVYSACIPGILSYEADPNIVDEVSGMSPLMYAVASGRLPITLALIRSGAGET